VVWLGVIVAPGALVEFCSETLVKRVAGMPFNKQVNAPVTFRWGPITVPEATPSAKPELSPLVIGVVVPMLCAGMPEISTSTILGTAIAEIAMFGYGTGTGAGAGGAGVKQTSGNAMDCAGI